jgi:hypothetical protein
MNNYFKKYLKYKQKYYNLKYGGMPKLKLDINLIKEQKNDNAIIINHLIKKKMIIFNDELSKDIIKKANNSKEFKVYRLNTKDKNETIIEDICNHEEKLGEGSFGVVYPCNNLNYVIKISNTSSIKKVLDQSIIDLDEKKNRLTNFIQKFDELNKYPKYFVHTKKVVYWINDKRKDIEKKIDDIEKKIDDNEDLSFPPYYIVYMNYLKGNVLGTFIKNNINNIELIKKILNKINNMILELKKHKIILYDFNMNNMMVSEIKDITDESFKEKNIIIKDSNKIYTIKFIDLDDVRVDNLKGFVLVESNNIFNNQFNRKNEEFLKYYISFDTNLYNFINNLEVENKIKDDLKEYWKKISS